MSASGTVVAGLIHEDKPRYDAWLKVTLGVILALTLIPGIVLLAVDTIGAWMMLGATAIDALLFWAILPRRFQIYDDRLRIVLGRPLALNIPFADIKEVRLAPRSQAFIYWGLRLATSSTGVVEVVRRKGLSVVISPLDPDIFLEQLNRVLPSTANSG